MPLGVGYTRFAARALQPRSRDLKAELLVGQDKVKSVEMSRKILLGEGQEDVEMSVRRTISTQSSFLPEYQDSTVEDSGGDIACAGWDGQVVRPLLIGRWKDRKIYGK